MAENNISNSSEMSIDQILFKLKILQKLGIGLLNADR